jgi:hypothetical protein
MGGGGSGGSKSSSKPKITPPQEAIWRYYMSDILPMARGEDTLLTRRMEQSARDEGERQRGKAMQGIMEMAGRTGMGAGEVASALQMISGLPMISQETKTKQRGTKSYLFGAYSG